MQIKTVIVVECCDKRKEFDNKFDVMDWAYKHIKQSHKELFLEIENKARLMAREMNGKGYFDSPKQILTESGWHNAQDSFKYAWCLDALKIYLKENKPVKDRTRSNKIIREF